MATYDVKQIALPGGDIANLKDGNAIHKSNTSGFVKNDGSIDQNTYQIAQEGKGLSTNDFTNEDKALIGQTLGNNTVLTTDKTPFLTRQTLNPTGFSGYVREKLVGASYAWNQLVQDPSLTDTSKIATRYCTFTVSGGVATFTPSSAGTERGGYFAVDKLISGHKYLVVASVKTTTAGTITIGFNGVSASSNRITVAANTWTRVGVIYEPAIASTDLMSVFQYNSITTSDTLQVTKPFASDLTLAFGSTIADYLYSLANNGGITKLRDMGCPIDKYTPYGYGLYSVKTSGKKIVGKNLLRNQLYQLNSNNIFLGATNSDNLEYYLVSGTYTISVSFTGSVSGVQLCYAIRGGSTQVIANTATITISASGYYRFWIAGLSTISTSMIDKFQLEIGSSATTYEPYTSTTYPLGNDELRGKFDLVNGEIVASGDVKESNGEITRNYGIVDLGTLTWINDGNGIFRCNNFNTNAKPATTYSGVANIIAEKYTAGGWGDVYDSLKTNTICYRQIATNDNRLAVVSGTSSPTGYMIFELITPTTEQSTPFADPMSLVGATTEEYIDTRDIPCPVGAERQYMGQSEDVVEIPSSPQSDGKRKLVAETSGGKTQYYFESEEEEDSEDISSVLHAYTGNTLSNVHARKYGKVIELAFTSTGSYETLTGLYVAHLTAYKPAKELNFTLYNAFNVPVGGVWITTTGIIYIRSTVEATLTEIKLNAMYIV